MDYYATLVCITFVYGLAARSYANLYLRVFSFFSVIKNILSVLTLVPFIENYLCISYVVERFSLGVRNPTAFLAGALVVPHFALYLFDISTSHLYCFLSFKEIQNAQCLDV